MGSSFISTGSGWPSHSSSWSFSCHSEMSQKDGAPRESCHMSCALPLWIEPTTTALPSPLLFYSLLIVIVLRSMPTKKDLRNEVGAIVHTVANRALSDHTAKNIFGNVNYANPITLNPIVRQASLRDLAQRGSCQEW